MCTVSRHVVAAVYPQQVMHANCNKLCADPRKNVIDPKDVDVETTAANIALTARLIRKAVMDARYVCMSV